MTRGRAIEYSGTNRVGSGVFGQTRTRNLESWVKVRFDAGWQSLSVTIDGETVAEITERNGARLWWARV